MTADKTSDKTPTETHERRASERVPVKIPATFSTTNSFNVKAIADQFSESGLFLGTESVCPLNSVLEVQIHLPNHAKPVRTRARVVYTNPYRPYVRTVLPPGMGIKFTSLLDEDRRCLMDFVRERLDQDRGLIKVDSPLLSRPVPQDAPEKVGHEKGGDDSGADMLRQAFGDSAETDDVRSGEAREVPANQRKGEKRTKDKGALAQKKRGKTEPEERAAAKSLWDKIRAALTKDLSGNEKKQAPTKGGAKKPAGQRGQAKRSTR